MFDTSPRTPAIPRLPALLLVQFPRPGRVDFGVHPLAPEIGPSVGVDLIELEEAEGFTRPGYGQRVETGLAPDDPLCRGAVPVVITDVDG